FAASINKQSKTMEATIAQNGALYLTQHKQKSSEYSRPEFFRCSPSKIRSQVRPSIICARQNDIMPITVADQFRNLGPVLSRYLHRKFYVTAIALPSGASQRD